MLIRQILSVALLLICNPVEAGSATTKPAKLEGMEYGKARSVILGYGWKPFPRECGGPSVKKSTCARFPELEYCQGIGRGFCGMTFTKGNRCLSLTTVESPPGQGGYTVVHDVAFAQRACSTSED